MNITPQVPNLSIPTVLNPHTESLRRDNNQREIITQPAPSHQSAAEKGVASDRERSRTPAQNNANIDFVSIKEQAELANKTITGQNQEQSDHSHHHAQGGQEGEDAQEPNVNNGSVSSQESPNSTNEQGQTSAQAIQQERVINELKKSDQEVRAHEAAHAAVGGSVTGPPTFTYQNGPNGQRYAVAGEVSVDLSPVSGDPRATIAKMQKVHAAALAPINPSSQDRQVASTATQIILQAQSELLSEMGMGQDEPQTRSGAGVSSPSSSKEYLLSDNEHNATHEHDLLMDETTNNQNEIGARGSDAIVKRALRIENFYANITQAYEKGPNFNFELTA